MAEQVWPEDTCKICNQEIFGDRDDGYCEDCWREREREVFEEQAADIAAEREMESVRR